jgi:hypothetical protein
MKTTPFIILKNSKFHKNVNLQEINCGRQQRSIANHVFNNQNKQCTLDEIQNESTEKFKFPPGQRTMDEIGAFYDATIGIVIKTEIITETATITETLRKMQRNTHTGQAYRSHFCQLITKRRPIERFKVRKSTTTCDETFLGGIQ